MMDASKYRAGYFPVDKKYNKWAMKDHIMGEGMKQVCCAACGRLITENLRKG